MQTILITVDALRADHLAQYGYDRDTIPVLDRLFGDGVRYASAYSNGPHTRVSLPSMFTSRYLGFEELSFRPTIPSVVGETGVRTTGIGTAINLADIQGDFLFDEYTDIGRDEFKEEADEDLTLRQRIPTYFHSFAKRLSPVLQRSDLAYSTGKAVFNRLRGVVGDNFQYRGYRSAADVTDAAIDWLEEHRDENFFLWISYMEGHRPYGVHDPDPAYLDEPVEMEEIKRLMWKAGTHPGKVTDEEHRTLIDLYDSNLNYCSRHLVRLADRLDSFGISEDANLMLTSDHGEEFREHGHYFHRNLPYEELLHVPLFLRTPSTEADVRDDPRELLDVAPTVCELHGLDADDYEFVGRPLSEPAEADRPLIALGSLLYKSSETYAIKRGRWKYLHADGAEFLFDLESDPGETESVSSAHPDVVEALISAIPDRLSEQTADKSREPTDDVDEGQLEALGYLET